MYQYVLLYSKCMRLRPTSHGAATTLRSSPTVCPLWYPHVPRPASNRVLSASLSIGLSMARLCCTCTCSPSAPPIRRSVVRVLIARPRRLPTPSAHL